MQLVRVSCLFTGHYNTDLHVTYTDNPTIFSRPDKYNIMSKIYLQDDDNNKYNV